jgi:hypothetical protein
MKKTIKIARPQFPRSSKGACGRVEHDSRGNAVWKRTRSEDAADIPGTTSLSIQLDSLGVPRKMKMRVGPR